MSNLSHALQYGTILYIRWMRPSQRRLLQTLWPMKDIATYIPAALLHKELAVLDQSMRGSTKTVFTIRNRSSASPQWRRRKAENRNHARFKDEQWYQPCKRDVNLGWQVLLCCGEERQTPEPSYRNALYCLRVWLLIAAQHGQTNWANSQLFPGGILVKTTKTSATFKIYNKQKNARWEYIHILGENGNRAEHPKKYKPYRLSTFAHTTCKATRQGLFFVVFC